MTGSAPRAAWGPQFQLLSLDAASGTGGGDAGDWERLAPVAGDAALLSARVDAMCAALWPDRSLPDWSDAERRVAASQVQMALTGRVLAVALADAACGLDAQPVLDGDLWWRDEPGLAFPVARRTPASPAGTAPTLAGGWAQQVSGTLHELTGVPLRVLWSNVASLVHTSCRIIAVAAPDRASAVQAARDALLRHPLVDPAERGDSRTFRRHGCCLLYRAMPGRAPACGDCVLLAG